MSNQPAIVSTEVPIRIIETTPAVVKFNYQEISDHLDGVLEKYRGLVFSDKDVAECKKTIAELRKGQKSLDEFRKATKKQLTESVTAFEAQCKTLYGRFDEVIKPLTIQQDQFELDRRELKRVGIQSVIDSLIASNILSKKYADQLVILEEYFNKGKTIKAISTELATLANTLSVQEDKEAQDIDLIKTKVQLANAQYRLDLIPDPYLRLLRFQSFAEIDAVIIGDAQKLREQEDERASALLTAATMIPKVEEVTEPAPVQALTPDTPPTSTITAIYEVTGTDQQLSELEAIMDAWSMKNSFSWSITEKSLGEDPDDDFMN